MQKRAYTEAELRSNRSSLLLYGGTEPDRRAWSQNLAESWPELGPFVVVSKASELVPAINRADGIVYVPDVAVLGRAGQLQVLGCLKLQEERPKVIIGLTASPEEQVTAGQLRDDLEYRLSIAQVNLAQGDSLTLLRNRMERRAAVVSREVAAQKARSVKANARSAARAARR